MKKSEMLMEFVTQDIVAWIMDEENVDLEEALNRFYSSVTFEKLTDEDTRLYLDSPASIYSLYCKERATGRFVQMEV